MYNCPHDTAPSCRHGKKARILWNFEVLISECVICAYVPEEVEQTGVILTV